MKCIVNTIVGRHLRFEIIVTEIVQDMHITSKEMKVFEVTYWVIFISSKPTIAWATLSKMLLALESSREDILADKETVLISEIYDVKIKIHIFGHIRNYED